MPSERSHQERTEFSKAGSGALVPYHSTHGGHSTSSRTRQDSEMRSLASNMSNLRTSNSIRHRSSSMGQHESSGSRTGQSHQPGGAGYTIGPRTHDSTRTYHSTAASDKTIRPSRTRAGTLARLDEDREVSFGGHGDSMALVRRGDFPSRLQSTRHSGNSRTSHGDSMALTKPSSSSAHHSSSSRQSESRTLTKASSSSRQHHGTVSKEMAKEKSITKVDKQDDGKNVVINVNKTVIYNDNSTKSKKVVSNCCGGSSSSKQCHGCLGKIEKKDRGYFVRNGYDYCRECSKQWYYYDGDTPDEVSFS